jgi:hypothetical protein
MSKLWQSLLLLIDEMPGSGQKELSIFSIFLKCESLISVELAQTAFCGVGCIYVQPTHYEHLE